MKSTPTNTLKLKGLSKKHAKNKENHHNFTDHTSTPSKVQYTTNRLHLHGGNHATTFTKTTPLKPLQPSRKKREREEITLSQDEKTKEEAAGVYYLAKTPVAGCSPALKRANVESPPQEEDVPSDAETVYDSTDEQVKAHRASFSSHPSTPLQEFNYDEGNSSEEEAEEAARGQGSVEDQVEEEEGVVEETQDQLTQVVSDDDENSNASDTSDDESLAKTQQDDDDLGVDDGGKGRDEGGAGFDGMDDYGADEEDNTIDEGDRAVEEHIPDEFAKEMEALRLAKLTALQKIKIEYEEDKKIKMINLIQECVEDKKVLDREVCVDYERRVAALNRRHDREMSPQKRSVYFESQQSQSFEGEMHTFVGNDTKVVEKKVVEKTVVEKKVLVKKAKNYVRGGALYGEGTGLACGFCWDKTVEPCRTKAKGWCACGRMCKIDQNGEKIKKALSTYYEHAKKHNIKNK